MKEVRFPYGKGHLSHSFEEASLLGVLESSLHAYHPQGNERELIEEALAHPVGSPSLAEMARGKNTVVVIISDLTRPVPSKLILPPMLKAIREGNPDADITLLVATGCHRSTTAEELIGKLGEEIYRREKIVVHDCDDRDNLVSLGTLPSGGDCEINRLAAEADLLVAEGFIEPHFFAGFSGGRKSVLPGVAGRTTVLANHCSEFIAHPCAVTGVLSGNPIHEDMLWAAETANLAFIVNVVLDADKKVIFATAGAPTAAHKVGTDFLTSLCGTKALPADVVITTNGGYPLDQNIYQAVKGMTAAEATVKEGGVVLMLAQSGDGVGGEHFYRQLADEPDITKTMALFLSRGRNETVPDQWQTQIFLRVLSRATVLYLSEAPDEVVEALHMIPVHSIAEGLEKAKAILNKDNITVTAIPDGVSVMVLKGETK